MNEVAVVDPGEVRAAEGRRQPVARRRAQAVEVLSSCQPVPPPQARIRVVREGTRPLDAAAAARHIAAIAARQDRDAFAALFAHFAPRLKAYLVRLGSPAQVAEDLAQETMIAVWRKAAYYDPAKAEAATWVFTIARNLRIDALRRERHPEVGVEPDPLIADDAPPADERLAEARRGDRLRAAMRLLPAEQADVVRLSFFDDKPHREIERELGIPLGTVKSRLRLAMTRLRTALGERE